MTGVWHPTGRAKVDQRHPQAIGVCQRSGFWFQRNQLVSQHEWAGVKLQNLELYVAPQYYDTPQHQLKTIVIPADPLPVYRPFPEDFTAANAGPTIGSSTPLHFGPGPVVPPAGLQDQPIAMTDEPINGNSRPNPETMVATKPARSGRRAIRRK